MPSLDTVIIQPDGVTVLFNILDTNLPMTPAGVTNGFTLKKVGASWPITPVDGFGGNLLADGHTYRLKASTPILNTQDSSVGYNASFGGIQNSVGTILTTIIDAPVSNLSGYDANAIDIFKRMAKLVRVWKMMEDQNLVDVKVELTKLTNVTAQYVVWSDAADLIDTIVNPFAVRVLRLKNQIEEFKDFVKRQIDKFLSNHVSPLIGGAAGERPVQVLNNLVTYFGVHGTKLEAYHGAGWGFNAFFNQVYGVNFPAWVEYPTIPDSLLTA